ncbi:MAG: flagellar motor switch protein FliM [Deltaproteobacteria bacterium]|nr:flagellar motor switch protein FliM [Deltaproteobacteria bacterium]
MDEVLTQEEINSLIKGLSETDIEDAALELELKGKNIKKYDLSNQERIVRGRMPTVELIHDRFARQYRTTLSKFLSRTCFANVAGIELVKFGAFMKKLPLPSSIHIYRMPPLPGYAFLIVSAPLVFGAVEILFGGTGSGRVKVEGREYTPIENRLVGKLVLLALDNLKDAWAPVHPVDFIYVRSEFNPLAIAIVPPTEVLIVVNIEIELDQESTSLQICIPYSTIDPLKHKLTTSFQSTRLEIDETIKDRIANILFEAPAEIRVQVGYGKISLSRLMTLETGDVIQLKNAPGDESVIIIQDKPKFFGITGVYRGYKAVKITRKIPDADLIKLKNDLEVQV